MAGPGEATSQGRRAARNLLPARDREVAVASVDGPLTIEALRERFVGREAYRRTRYLVVRSGDDCALLGVDTASEEPLMSPITDCRLLARPDECAVVEAPDVDTAVPTQMARLALRQPVPARCTVVHGRYQHVGFIVDADPIRVRVTDVVPPEPAKLVDQAERVLATAEHLPPVELVADLVDVGALVARASTRHVLLPCEVAGVPAEGAELRYLDQRPSREDWTLVGCTRSEQLHEWFYGDLPPMIDLCPARRQRAGDLPALAKCCLLEEGITAHAGGVQVGWGATLEDVRDALERLVGTREVPWQAE